MWHNVETATAAAAAATRNFCFVVWFYCIILGIRAVIWGKKRAVDRKQETIFLANAVYVWYSSFRRNHVNTNIAASNLDPRYDTTETQTHYIFLPILLQIIQSFAIFFFLHFLLF